MIRNLINRITQFTVGARINFIKTLYINFMAFPIKVAIKIPIYVYGPCKIAHIDKGSIVLVGDIKRGMIRIGKTHPVKSYHSKSYIEIHGILKMHDGNILRRGIHLQISKSGVFSIGKNTTIGTNCTIMCFKSIYIGDNTSVGGETTIMDSDFHYVVDLENRSVFPKDKDIYIDDNCWIGANCTIKKGTKIPIGTIVAGPYSMIGKDYTTSIPEYSIIGGSPSKLIKSGYRRINNNDIDKDIYTYYKNNTKLFFFSSDIKMEDVCIPQKTE